MDRLKYVVNVLIVALLLSSIVINKDGRLFGGSIDGQSSNETTETKEVVVETIDDNGVRVINSRSLANDVSGYAGRTPVTLYVENGVILRVEPQENSETPSFFNLLSDRGLFNHWDGMPLEDAALSSVDVVSGATFSSMSIIKNVQRAAAYASKVETKESNPFSGIELKSIIGLLVVLSGVALTFVRPKNKIFELVQLALNVVVLGFWCGSFLSLTQLVSWMGNGFNLTMSLVSIALLAVVIIVPLFGRKGSYCHLHCPMGSAQALLDRVAVPKLKLSAGVNKILGKVRYYILLALLFVMWLGVGFSLMDYEVFSAFLLSSASTFVLILAGVFLLLSLFVTKPYCRFVCPTGALLTMMQKTKE